MRSSIPRVLGIIAWLLIGLAAAGIVASLWTTLPIIQRLQNPLQRLQNPLLPAGLLLAFAGQLLAESRAARDRQEKQSKFYLDSCLVAYEEASALLLDGNNDRAKWIAAARALAHQKQLARGVTDESHVRVLELQKLKYRKVFHDVLVSKTASSFYGAADPNTPLDQAAEMSTAAETRFGRVCTSTVQALSEISIYAVWAAAQWPKDYDDPLQGSFTEKDEAQLMVLYPQLHEYLEHRAKWHSASGRLFPNPPK